MIYTILAIFLALSSAVGFMAYQLVTITTKRGRLSMKTVDDRKAGLIQWMKDHALNYAAKPGDYGVFIAMRDVPLFEELAAEGKFVVINGYWEGLRVRVADMDMEKGEPCTRIDRKDCKGYRYAKPWAGRNGTSLLTAH